MSETISPNTRLAQHTILSMLGAGGRGEVYLAQDHKLDRKVALKILPAGRRVALKLLPAEFTEIAHVNHFAWGALAQALFFRKEFDPFRDAAERSIALKPMDRFVQKCSVGGSLRINFSS